MDNIILVDEFDNEIGVGDKMYVHQKELLHRAFSIFIYDYSTQKLLLQKRANSKYHSGGLWTNACCSHPRHGEDIGSGLKNRLSEELGLNLEFNVEFPDYSEVFKPRDNTIYHVGSFHYFARFDNLCENEIDHVYLFSPSQVDFSAINPNKDEVSEIRWISLDKLDTLIDNQPDLFTAWFIPAYKLAFNALSKQSTFLK